MSKSRTNRIFFYSHDTFGLGHIRRTQKIANALAEPERSILIACASPKASSYASQSGIDYLNLPGFTKQRSGEYSPRSLHVPIDEFTSLRSQILLSSIRSFQPDIIFIDKEPLGVKRELYPALEFVKTHLKKTKVICGFRDILDENEVVQEEWRRRDTVRALERFFDNIFIYGERDIFNFEEAYRVSDSLSKKIYYTGYIQPESFLDTENVQLDFKNSNQPLVTLTLGGGGDGHEILDIFSEYLASKDYAQSTTDINFLILTGPFIPSSSKQKIDLVSNGRANLIVKDFIANPSQVFQKCDLVISMGGYNTMCELASMQKKPLILPRTIPRKEQLIRAQAFADRNLCDYLLPEEINPKGINDYIRKRLTSSSLGSEFKTTGLDLIAKYVARELSVV